MMPCSAASATLVSASASAGETIAVAIDGSLRALTRPMISRKRISFVVKRPAGSKPLGAAPFPSGRYFGGSRRYNFAVLVHARGVEHELAIVKMVSSFHMPWPITSRKRLPIA